MLGLESEISEYVSGLMIKLGGDYLESMIMRQYILMDVYVVCMSACEGFSPQDTEGYANVTDFKNRMTDVKKPEEVEDFIYNVIKETISFRDMVSSKKTAKLINRAISIIEQEYGNRDFNLGYMANKLAVNKSYLSRLFLQEMGKTFTDYLVDFRLKKGEELLKDTDMTVTAISLEIGYNDPHYFSYVYKKDRGYTPRDYRMKQRTIDE